MGGLPFKHLSSTTSTTTTPTRSSTTCQKLECEKDTAVTLAVLLVLETLLGAILIAFPKSRVCINAALDLVRAMRVFKTPPVVDAPAVVVVDVGPSTSAHLENPLAINPVQGKAQTYTTTIQHHP